MSAWKLHSTFLIIVRFILYRPLYRRRHHHHHHRCHYQHHRPGHPHKHIQTLSTYPNRGLFAQSFHPTQQTIRYPRGQVPLLRRTSLSASHTAKCLSIRRTSPSKCFQQPASRSQSSQSSSLPLPANLTSPRSPPHSSALSILETLIFSKSSPATQPSTFSDLSLIHI